MKAILTLAILCHLLMTSCASVMTGKTDLISVNSSPVGAAFTTNVGIKGVTPTKIEVPDNTDIEFTFEKEGYAPATYTAPRKMSGWVWGNIVLGGVIGLVVDFASGGVYTHEKEVVVTLAPASN